MALIEEFDRSGNWLFKRRSYLPLVLYLIALLVIIFDHREFMPHTGLLWSLLCLAVSFSGLAIRAFTIGYTPAGTSGRNTGEGQVAEQLNTAGIYSLLRHPLYLGNFMMWLGLFLYVGNVWFVITACLLFWLYYERIMFAEEHFLRRKFGDAYLKWSSATPAFLPHFGHYRKAGLDFSLRNVLKREYNGFFATIISFMALDFAKHAIHQANYTLSTHWIYIGILGFLIFFTLRTLKKATKVLEVKGR
jgi:protein-S-isoprenylcysteine O-methyltransferase Ste14